MRKTIILFTLLISVFTLQAQDIGHATFYGRKFHKRKTASGEIYHRDSLVCAHKTYPFGTLLKVKSLDNNKEVVVRVIDRGPFSKKRIIDLSHAAAKELDMLRKGVVKVEVSELKDEWEPILLSDTTSID